MPRERVADFSVEYTQVLDADADAERIEAAIERAAEF